MFGLTTSTGKTLTFLVPQPWNTVQWAQLIRTKVGPFLVKEFPNLDCYEILLDGESVLRGPEAKKAFKDSFHTQPKTQTYAATLARHKDKCRCRHRHSDRNKHTLHTPSLSGLEYYSFARLAKLFSRYQPTRKCVELVRKGIEES